MEDHRQLAAYRPCVERINSNWAAFSGKRKERLQQHALIGPVTEKATENLSSSAERGR
ncbi:MAG: hypothetical protein NTX71_11515 [Candidatus Aureabacteria bacterium]|nr:hypothetical protein [Candidatus Auribacterota bacterium]